MKVLALISGGKDSFMSLDLCRRDGHEARRAHARAAGAAAVAGATHVPCLLQVVLLGNLRPADARVEELDSHMYQTAGHAVVEAYAACTGLPLLRRRIRGTSLQARRVLSVRPRTRN